MTTLYALDGRGQLHLGDTIIEESSEFKYSLAPSVQLSTGYRPSIAFPHSTHNSNNLLRKYGEILPRMRFILHNLIYN